MLGPTSRLMGKVRKTYPDQDITIHLLRGNKKEKKVTWRTSQVAHAPTPALRRMVPLIYHCSLTPKELH